MAVSTDWKTADRSRGEEYEPLPMLFRWWETIDPAMPFTALSVEEFGPWAAALRARVETALGRVPEALSPAPEVLAEGELEPGVRFRYGEVVTAPGMRAPYMLLVPARLSAPAPAVLCLHGHGDGMNPLFGLNAHGDPLPGDEYQQTFALEACRRGFVALAFDQLAFGRRRDLAHMAQYEAPACDSATAVAFQLGSSMAALRVFEARQLLTLLGLQPEVDAERMGAAGISGGGLVCFFLTVVDPRVKAAMVSGFFNRFSAFMHIRHCVDNFVPGLAHLAEMPDMGCTIAPRPLLISQGLRDPIFPIAATREGVAQLRRAYALFGAKDRLEEEYYDAEHVFSNARVWDFLRQWLC